MKVISSSAIPLVMLLVACCYASPMFGTGGMMKRKFPGAPEMSYQTYREIANSNAAAAASGVAPRTGGSDSRDTAWMFGNELSSSSTSTSSNQPGSITQTGLSFNQQQPSFNQQQPSFNQQQPSFNQQQPSFNQQQPSFNQQQPSFNQQQPSSIQHRLPFYPQDSYNRFQGSYPSVWEPQDSNIFMQFPFLAPTPLDHDYDFVPQKKVFRHNY